VERLGGPNRFPKAAECSASFALCLTRPRYPPKKRGGSPLSNITDVLNGLSSASLWQERVYKDLHAHPELSFHETRTAALAWARRAWIGSWIARLKPAEEVAGCAKRMLKYGLRDRIPTPDAAFAQHLLAYTGGTGATHFGPALSAGYRIRIALHGKGAHGSMP